MIDVFFFSGFPVAVFGLGRSGLATAKALVASGAEVWAWDDNEDRCAAARAEDIPLVDLYTCNWSELTSLILSPGVPLAHPEPHPIVTKALAADCEVIGDIELLGRAQRDAGFIGITGTNGKSTTTALAGHILEMAGQDVEVGGNLGVPALALAPLESGGTYVLEMSSYQLDLTRSITFDVAVLLNISEDHLDRHGGIDGYIAAKRQIFHRQTRPRTAIIGLDDAYCRDIFQALKAADDQNIIGISGTNHPDAAIRVEDGWLIDDAEGQAVKALDLKTVATLPGAHNWQNAAAAYALAKAAGVQPPVIVQAIRTYPGLVHRQELLDIVDGISFVNDSKATNPESAARALASYASVYWIAGGRAKSDHLDPVMDHLDHVRHAYLIGESCGLFEKLLGGRAPITVSGTLDVATRQAFDTAKQEAVPDPVVLLSPACASFDQFADFEARGDAFRSAVAALPGDHVDPFDQEVA